MIPVRNLYYLLSYSWKSLDKNDLVNTSSDDYEDLLNLLVRALRGQVNFILKRGLERKYNSIAEEYVGIKGKMLLNQTLKGNVLNQGKTICSFDEYNYNTPFSLYIKNVLKLLIKTKGVEKEYKDDVKYLFSKLGMVREIQASSTLKVIKRFHRNNLYYRSAIDICELILENLKLNEMDGQYKFYDFVRDEVKMRTVFENFLFNFYKSKSDFHVSRPHLKWESEHLAGDTYNFPIMRTDICLIKEERHIIMDAKYYKDALKEYRGNKTFYTGNVYQMYAYLSNYSESTKREGILVYPTVGYELNSKYKVNGYNIKFVTVDLDQDWQDIERALLSFLE